MCNFPLMAAAGFDVTQVMGVVFGLFSIALLIVVPIIVIRLRRKYMGTPVRVTVALPGSGRVRFVFHKYSGFLIFVRQTRYDTVLSIDQADALLKQLVRHNLTWGLFVYGGVLVPIFTYFEWRSQKKRIAAARPGFPVSV